MSPRLHAVLFFIVLVFMGDERGLNVRAYAFFFHGTNPTIVTAPLDDFQHVAAFAMPCLSLAKFEWSLRGLGFHRKLSTHMEMHAMCDHPSMHALLVYTVPRTHFVDPFELSRMAFQDGTRVMVEGEVELEKAATFCEETQVKVEIDVREAEEGQIFSADVAFPIHARYPAAEKNLGNKSTGVNFPFLRTSQESCQAHFVSEIFPPDVFVAWGRQWTAEESSVSHENNFAKISWSKDVEDKKWSPLVWKVPAGCNEDLWFVMWVTTGWTYLGAIIMVWVVLAKGKVRDWMEEKKRHKE